MERCIRANKCHKLYVWILSTSLFVRHVFGAPPPLLNLCITKSLPLHYDKGKDKVVISWAESNKVPMWERRTFEELSEKVWEMNVRFTKGVLGVYG
ncbi:hypothetical protein [Sphingobacterium sp. SYP-B4668]|uniref:hypothetical protein n=1 Tax=Sphingobacterium sp. SYP-B4668 TaxID=2996035 RepID=UPI0022DE3722|nr:hypothetical protein [Sphingobacterium sp. SYP-B4668]